MRRSLFSPLWYRVSGLRPRLHADVQVECQRHRDQVWYLLIDGASGRQFRINPEAYAFIGRCDGERTVEQTWDTLLEDAADAAPTQDEVLQLLASLTERGLLDAAGAGKQAARPQPRSRPGAMLNPFAFRVPLGDPWALLQRLDPLQKLMFFPAAGWLWLALVGTAVGAAAINWSELASAWHGTRWLWLAWLVFPFLKAWHELAHALAVRHFGGEVHKAGFTLFLLTPTPYVDASAAAGFRARHQRAIVGAAGIEAELAVAALALLVWLNVQPGLVRDLAFATFFSGSVSSVLFNGNPLLRFDAYHVLCDLFELPSLAQRSGAWWGQRARRLLGAGAAEDALAPARGETKWLVAYAPLAFACRLILGIGIVLWLGELSLVLGTIAALACVAGLVRPPAAAAWRLLREQRNGGARLRLAFAVSLCGAACLGMVFALPVPLHTAAIGVVWLPEQARVRPDTSGFVARLNAADGASVRAGDVLVDLSDPTLAASRERLLSRATELTAERYSALATEKPERSAEFEQELARNEAELRNIDQRIAGLTVRSNLNGRLVLVQGADLPGTFAERGSTLGYVLDREQIVVRAAINQQDAALVREQTRGIEVRLADAPGVVLIAQAVREVPAAHLELPSPALGDTGGGPYVTDPDDKKGLRLLQPVMLIDLKLPTQHLERVGGRAWVRFDHGSEPLASQLYRYGRQLFLARFNPAQ